MQLAVDPIQFFLIVLKGTLLSSGGLSNLPSIHQDLRTVGWATDRQFAEALAIGQFSPGPAGLWAVALGYLIGGLPGAGVAAFAVALPPLLILLIGPFQVRLSSQPSIRGLVRGIALAAAAVTPVITLGILANLGVDLVAVGILVVSILLIATRRLPIVLVMTLSALAGAVFYR